MGREEREAGGGGSIIMQQANKLELKLTQKLAMTMQMQQAIRILQLSAQDLRSAIEQEYLENPTLEIEYEEGAFGKEDPFAVEDITALAGYLDEGGGQPAYFTEALESRAEAAAPLALTLEQELLRQAAIAFGADEDTELAVATFIIGSIDHRGYLTLPLAEIGRATGTGEAQVQAVLQRVQTFEPVGVAARDLAECLRLQARSRGIYEGLVAAIIDRHLPEVAEARLKEIAAAEGARPEDVQLAVDILKTLDPKPGSAYGGEETAYITPDVIVEKADGEYRARFNDSYVPRLHISSLYKQAEGFDKATQAYLKDKLKAASWLVSSIEQRRRTILQVMEELLRRQRDFLDKGPEYLKPLSMKEVADAIGVHESTVSRAVANKYAELPGGILPLRQFFQARASREAGEDFLASQAKAALAKLIKEEDPKKPLSDQKLCQLLQEQQMELSRRTVMKYREQLGYPSSVKRKRY